MDLFADGVLAVFATRTRALSAWPAAGSVGTRCQAGLVAEESWKPAQPLPFPQGELKQEFV